MATGAGAAYTLKGHNSTGDIFGAGFGAGIGLFLGVLVSASISGETKFKFFLKQKTKMSKKYFDYDFVWCHPYIM
jgi:hypothetical protein